MSIVRCYNTSLSALFVVECIPMLDDMHITMHACMHVQALRWRFDVVVTMLHTSIEVALYGA